MLIAGDDFAAAPTSSSGGLFSSLNARLSGSPLRLFHRWTGGSFGSFSPVRDPACPFLASRAASLGGAGNPVRLRADRRRLCSRA